MLRFVAWTLLCCAVAAATGTPEKAVDGQGGIKGGKAPPAALARQEQAAEGRERAIEELASAVIADPEAFRAVLAFRKAAAALSDVGEGKLGIVFKAKKDAERIQKAEEALRKFEGAMTPKKPKGPELEAAIRPTE